MNFRKAPRASSGFIFKKRATLTAATDNRQILLLFCRHPAAICIFSPRLLPHFRHRSLQGGPVETEGRCTLLHLIGPQQRRQAGVDPSAPGAPGSSRSLTLSRGRRSGKAARDRQRHGVAPDQQRRSLDDRSIESPRFPGDLAVENHLQEKIAQLFLQSSGSSLSMAAITS